MEGPAGAGSGSSLALDQSWELASGAPAPWEGKAGHGLAAPRCPHVPGLTSAPCQRCPGSAPHLPLHQHPPPPPEPSPRSPAGPGGRRSIAEPPRPCRLCPGATAAGAVPSATRPAGAPRGGTPAWAAGKGPESHQTFSKSSPKGGFRTKPSRYSYKLIPLDTAVPSACAAFAGFRASSIDSVFCTEGN